MDNLGKVDNRHRTAPSGDAPAFLPEGAFVVQLKAGTALRGEALVGRVEHVVSGRATHFESPADLLAFMRETLQPHPLRVEDSAQVQGGTGTSGKR